MVRRFLQKFMAGRYGSDQLNNFLMVLWLILWVVSMVTNLHILYWIALVLVLVTLLRSMSRKVDRRRAENARFLQLIRPAAKKLRNLRTRAKDRDHRYFRCPCCKQQMRVPKGKGRITVHCRSCGTSFEQKS